jgi:transposase
MNRNRVAACTGIRIQRVTPSLIADLRDLSRQRESLVDEMTALKINIKRLLNITFPELEHMTLVFTKAMLKLLQQYPSAFALRSAETSFEIRLLPLIPSC